MPYTPKARPSPTYYDLGMDESKTNPEFRLKARSSALDHARIMANHSAEIRMRNFNFFILATGVLVAGLAKSESSWFYSIIDVGGALISFVALGIDVRGYTLLTYSSRKVEKIEPLLWEDAGLDDWKPSPAHSGGFVFLSGRVPYRSLFTLVGLGWIVALIFRITRH
jgi:hypothetical protein